MTAIQVATSSTYVKDVREEDDPKDGEPQTANRTNPVLVGNDDIAIFIVLKGLVVIVEDDSSHGVLLHVAVIALLHILIVYVISHTPTTQQHLVCNTPLQHISTKCVQHPCLICLSMLLLFANMKKILLFTLSDNLLTQNHIFSFCSSLLTEYAISTIFLVE